MLNTGAKIGPYQTYSFHGLAYPLRPWKMVPQEQLYFYCTWFHTASPILFSHLIDFWGFLMQNMYLVICRPKGYPLQIVYFSENAEWTLLKLSQILYYIRPLCTSNFITIWMLKSLMGYHIWFLGREITCEGITM